MLRVIAVALLCVIPLTASAQLVGATGSYKRSGINYGDFANDNWTFADFDWMHDNLPNDYLSFQYVRIPTGSNAILSLAPLINTILAANPTQKITWVERIDIAPTPYRANSGATSWAGGQSGGSFLGTDGGAATCICDGNGDGTCGDAGAQNVCGTWGGDHAGFDTDWIARIPIAEYTADLALRWDGDDIFSYDGSSPTCDMSGFTAHTYGSGLLDCNLIDAVADGTSVPNMEISRQSLADYNVAAVMLDICDPDARAWRVADILMRLEDIGISGSDRITVALSNKLGWSAYYGPGSVSIDPGDVCRDEVNDRQFSGRPWGCDETVVLPDTDACDGGITAPTGCDERSGLLGDTSYGDGEYEACSEAFTVELAAALDAAAPDFVNVTLMTSDGGINGWKGPFGGVSNPGQGQGYRAIFPNARWVGQDENAGNSTNPVP